MKIGSIIYVRTRLVVFDRYFTSILLWYGRYGGRKILLVYFVVNTFKEPL